jgi:hypothetical protein
VCLLANGWPGTGLKKFSANVTVNLFHLCRGAGRGGSTELGDLIHNPKFKGLNLATTGTGLK